MTNSNQLTAIKSWMSAFGQETPNRPAIPTLDVRKLRAKLILEEALETIRGMGVEVTDSSGFNLYSIEDFAFAGIEYNLKTAEEALVEVLDGCIDLEVVTKGTLAAFGLSDNEAFEEVMRSNWTKLWTNGDLFKAYDESKTIKSMMKDDVQWDQFFARRVKNSLWLVKDLSGKVIKSPSYSPAELSKFI